MAIALALVGGPVGVAAIERGKPRARPPQPFRIGIVAPARSDAALDRLEPYRRRVGEVLGVEARVERLPDERALVAALVAGRIDQAGLSGAGYATARRSCGCVEPLVVPRAADGSAGFHAVVVVRTGSPITAPRDLDGRRLAVAGERAIVGRRLATALLTRDAGSAVTPRLETVEGPRAALAALIAGRVEAAMVWSTLEGDVTEGYGRGTLHYAVAAGEANMADLRVIWTSPVLPHGPQVVQSRLDEARRRALGEMLIDLADVDPAAYEAIEPVHGGGFLRIGASAYAPYLDLIEPPPAPAATTGAVPAGAVSSETDRPPSSTRAAADR
ncbi:phosphate/phosphite/phosphonate ABC transporter substrate-binding protein [Siculibacillus lacustris]|uniref:phosphate/phosphite/phosphonate ABC transporter substrate-binding protein n=1 Tax=Siculibacillus lacustris TaxID=1549641 RepID=UPI0013F16A86|nr:PhnD/SsuA/transferrin family substrate-binding protein [Siculibacillus lacustris]